MTSAQIKVIIAQRAAKFIPLWWDDSAVPASWQFNEGQDRVWTASNRGAK